MNPSYPFRRLPYASAFLSLVLSSGGAAGEPTPAATKVQPPAHHKILQLRVIPSQVEFSNPREYRKILVVGKTDQAQEIDVSSESKLTPAADCVRSDGKGFLYPARDCQTKVLISAGGLQAELPVTVRGLTQPHPVTFVRDVEPILNKAGCTSGTCHGAAKGKNGFKLSLRGYDPEFDYDRLVHDVSGRRFNRADPARSLMLLKPTAQVPHGGGLRFEVGSAYYNTILQWIAEGTDFGDPVSATVSKLEVTPPEILFD